jgi:hypothetical protein
MAWPTQLRLCPRSATLDQLRGQRTADRDSDGKGAVVEQVVQGRGERFVTVDREQRSTGPHAGAANPLGRRRRWAVGKCHR